MKKLVRNSMLVGAAVLGIGSLGTVAQAATTPASPVPSTSSTATADITPGKITLSSAPSFQFGTVAASANDISYTSTSTSGTLDIADAGTGTGYTVTVAASPFTATGGAALKNAQLSLDNKETDPIKADDADNVSTPPTLVAKLSLSSSPVTVVSAAAGSGVGAYTGTYGSTDASLKVPAGNIGGSYSSTLTWTLANAPA
ncbi:coaggregation promoting factor [Schleiferilactobacillus harbinensis DSM 16991]|uniref:Coaggregation promoting factor n=1 Tax=Schleiferilactobacillus harbinensis DSM 16991 TaxID=1122147 RepID=A0A0R1X8W6_9LACO|nr:WxL domain-containing protein [Schleiferilactobacillus harbinensis]KRM26682.1 coaggregation promoting factor [Schleiferilactobacillus harbinensis DSM 16991]